jgi:hypothetical protein
MVLMGINRIYVMKQAGLCVDESCGGFGLISFIFWGHNSGDQLKKKQPDNCFSIITAALDTSHE